MKEIIYKDKKIFYRAEGNGKPLILVHGFAEDGRIWDDQVAALREKWRVIVPDLPGSGNSEMIEGDVEISDLAEVIKAVADVEIKNESSRLTIIGHSMGGYICMAFAEKYSFMMNGLGLFHSSAYADDEKKKETRRKGIEFINKNGAQSFLKSTIPNLFSEDTKKESPESIEKLINLSSYFTEAPLVQYYEAMMNRPDTTNVLASLNMPLLLIQGFYDNAVPLQAGLEQAQIPSTCFFHILKKSAHMGMWEEKDTSNGYLSEFLENLPDD